MRDESGKRIQPGLLTAGLLLLVTAVAAVWAEWQVETSRCLGAYATEADCDQLMLNRLGVPDFGSPSSLGDTSTAYRLVWLAIIAMTGLAIWLGRRSRPLSTVAKVGIGLAIAGAIGTTWVVWFRDFLPGGFAHRDFAGTLSALLLLGSSVLVLVSSVMRPPMAEPADGATHESHSDTSAT